MLTYLVKNTRLDAEYVVHQYDGFQQDPREPHENTIDRIGRYLLGTRNIGLSFKLSCNVISFECYVDADIVDNYTK